MDYSQYEVIVTGIPKSGTNATEKACKLLNANPSPHQHTANYRLANQHKVVCVFRHPRNVLVSAVRYQNHQIRGMDAAVTEKKMIDQFFDFFNGSLSASYAAYMKWFGTKAHILKFEELFEPHSDNQQTLDALADYLGKPRQWYDPTQLLGGTYTWTGRLSQWQEHWTPELDKLWIEEGMIDIETKLGYIPA